MGGPRVTFLAQACAAADACPQLRFAHARSTSGDHAVRRVSPVTHAVHVSKNAAQKRVRADAERGARVHKSWRATNRCSDVTACRRIPSSPRGRLAAQRPPAVRDGLTVVATAPSAISACVTRRHEGEARASRCQRSQPHPGRTAASANRVGRRNHLEQNGASSVPHLGVREARRLVCSRRVGTRRRRRVLHGAVRAFGASVRGQLKGGGRTRVAIIHTFGDGGPSAMIRNACSSRVRTAEDTFECSRAIHVDGAWWRVGEGRVR
ncbi:hypothetical protein DES52_11319 [Deinococcus yavapaiensis KR-236]|uniref:Uncharacterized protein n=1 Tax=Deinococcus yavapaiensis KR-236 TaxID=694435 RepID=A0A318SJ64_9DEIO|nr:hypothetical protein DES52_11319 [Deinococcus yavapaiensis KR-236]